MRTSARSRSGASSSRPRTVRGVILLVLVLLLAASAHAALNTQGAAHGNRTEPDSDVRIANMAGVRPLVESQLLAIDLGAEWLKAAVLRVETTPTGVKGGAATHTAGVQLVLNDQSHRKSEPCVAFRYFPTTAVADGSHERERAFAASAAALEPRFPLQVVCNPSILLGRAMPEATEASSADAMDPSAFRNTMTSLANHTNGTVRASLAVAIPAPQTAGGSELYSAEELVGMILSYAKRMAEKADAEINHLTSHEQQAMEALTDGAPAQVEEAPNTVRYAVLTVPTFATLAYRQALVDAAALAGLRVVRLVHAATAAVVELAQLRAEQLFASPTANTTYVLIYDMGSRQTEAAVYELTSSGAVTGITGGAPQRVSAITLKALAADHSLGGKAFDRCIAEYWDTTFLGHRVFGPVSTSEAEAEAQRKAQVSLLRAAQRAREVLSANREAVVTVEGVSAHAPASGTAATPFATSLSRETFNTVCAPLFRKAAQVRDEAVEALATALRAEAGEARPSAALSLVDHVEVIGGATRMPRLLEVLGHGTGNGVGRRLNGDEAAVLGAVHLGAPAANLVLPGTVYVSEWLTNDIDFTVRSTAGDEADDAASVESEGEASAAAPVLFPRQATRLPAMKSVRLRDPRYTTGDFEFSFVSPLPAASREASSVGYRQTYAIDGVAKAVSRAQEWQRLSTFTTPRVSQAVQAVASEVVVEAAVSESGLPRVHKAYLRMVFNKTTTTTTITEGSPASEAASTDSTRTDSGDSATAPASTSGEDKARAAEDGEEELVVVEEEEMAPILDAAAAAATDAPTGASEPPSARTDTVSKRVVRVFDLHAHPIDSPASRSLNMQSAELARSKATLARLQRDDDLRWLRSALSNDIETLVLRAKSSDAWESAVAQNADWTRVVHATSVWLEDHGDTASLEELTAHKTKLTKMDVPTSVV